MHICPHHGKAGPTPALTRNRRSASARGAASRNTVARQRLHIIRRGLRDGAGSTSLPSRAPRGPVDVCAPPQERAPWPSLPSAARTGAPRAPPCAVIAYWLLFLVAGTAGSASRRRRLPVLELLPRRGREVRRSPRPARPTTSRRTAPSRPTATAPRPPTACSPRADAADLASTPSARASRPGRREAVGVLLDYGTAADADGGRRRPSRGPSARRSRPTPTASRCSTRSPTSGSRTS